ncbi:hypothetical protein C5167_011860 [Papaver somniferum]|uniref:Senescence domain-containing protein n=1 Tax=Papaver somniferum TaxID=3469 RepID=A0A4Y7IXW9_PAPSO|nr:senescence/dehydration-associated protein At4g35985, chloroplastic-like [Papaver somniferum]RZC53006.1 hypothetical protein C5167_011860 [Papaver somniferum]
MMFFSFLSKSLPSSNKPSPENTFESSPVTTTSKEELLLQIPGCTVNLVQEGEAEEIAKGNFNLAKLSAESVTLAIQIKVGDELQWPLTKEEPVVKLNELNYLFPLSMEDMNLTYGVSFSQQSGSGLTDLDSFLKEHSCFSGVSSSSPSETTSNTRALNWAELAPKIEKYSAILAQVMPGRTGEIIKGISRLSNACTQQVAKGGAMVITEATEETKADLETETNKSSKKTTNSKKRCVLSKGLARVRAVSENTEKRSKTVLNIIEMGTGSAVGPISSHAGGEILATGPGKVLLDSIGAFSNFMDAAEAAEKKALSASSKAATKMVSERFGESAGEVTEDVFAIAGHAPSTAFNIVKIRKAVDPASSFSSAMVKNAIRMNL